VYYYELWHLPSANLVDDFETEAGALEAALQIGDTTGLGLARRGRLGGTEWIARDAELARLARQALAR
jgi:hypothetical protein